MVKMAVKLINCNKEEQRLAIRFLRAKGVPGATDSSQHVRSVRA